jgi:hypothetical protein
MCGDCLCAQIAVCVFTVLRVVQIMEMMDKDGNGEITLQVWCAAANSCRSRS